MDLIILYIGKKHINITRTNDNDRHIYILQTKLIILKIIKFHLLLNGEGDLANNNNNNN